MKSSIRNFLSSSSSSQPGEGLTTSNNINHQNAMISSTSMRASSASSQGSSQPLPHTIEGTFNYFISVEVRGDKWLQSCNVGVNVFADANKTIPIAAKFKWFRILGESRCYPLAEIAGNTFQCSAQDLCSRIKCDVHPLDAAEDQCKGVASITFGPIDLELSIRETLTSILATATTKFQAQILVNEQVGKQRQAVRCELYVSGESMRLVIGEKSLKFRYSLDFPDIRINYLDVNKLLLAFDSNHSDVTTQLYQLLSISQALPLNATQDRIVLPLQMETRTQRDLIYLTHKALATKSYLIDSRIVRNMENSLDSWNDKSQQMFGVSDMLLVVEGLKKELDNMIKSYKHVAADRDKQAKENDRLEMEIKDTIEIYTRMIEQIKESQDETMLNNGMNNNYNSHKNLGNYSNNILDQSMQQAYSMRDDRGLKSKLKSMEQERLKITEQLKVLEEENEVLKQIVSSSKETNPSLVKGSWQQREGGTADLKRQLREMENQLREYKLNESFSDQRIFEQKLSSEKNKNITLQQEINRLQEIISQSHFQQNGLIVTGIQQKLGLPQGFTASINSLQTSKKPVMHLDPPTPIERLNKELLDCKKELEIAQRELALKENYQKDSGMIVQGLLGNGMLSYSPGKGNSLSQNSKLAEQLAMKEQELIAAEFKQEELKRENSKLQVQLLQSQSMKQHQGSSNQHNGQNMSFLNESSILLEDAHVLGSTQQDRRAAREREIAEYKNKISSLEKKLLQQQSQTQQIGGISFYEDASGLKSENAFLKSKIDSLQKELNNKAGDRNQQFEMAALLANNEKIVKENAELTHLNRKLIDEIDILRNTSKSAYNEVSVSFGIKQTFSLSQGL